MKKLMIIITVILALGTLGGISSATTDGDGLLVIRNSTPLDNYTDGWVSIFRSGDMFCTDGWDTLIDVQFEFGSFMESLTWSNINHVYYSKLLADIRPADGTTDIFTLSLALNDRDGGVTRSNSLYIKLFPITSGEIPFDDLEILLLCNRLRYGYIVNVRTAWALADPEIGAEIKLFDLVSDDPRWPSSYGLVQIFIGDFDRYSILCDFNDDGSVNLTDMSMLASDWKKPYGKYRTDIAGPGGSPSDPNGLPDGYVNEYDLQLMAEGWLVTQIQ